jgi:hypothetical protein
MYFELRPKWKTWTPRVDQGASLNIARTIEYAKYIRLGDLVIASFHLTMTAAGTAGSAAVVYLPVPMVNTNALGTNAGWVYDAVGAYRYTGSWFASGVDKVLMVVAPGPPPGGYGVTPNKALANGDVLRGTIVYEAAS